MHATGLVSVVLSWVIPPPRRFLKSVILRLHERYPFAITADFSVAVLFSAACALGAEERGGCWVLREYETVLDDVDDGGIHLGRIVFILVHLEVLLLHGYYCTRTGT